MSMGGVVMRNTERDVEHTSKFNNCGRIKAARAACACRNDAQGDWCKLRCVQQTRATTFSNVFREAPDLFPHVFGKED